MDGIKEIFPRRNVRWRIIKRLSVDETGSSGSIGSITWLNISGLLRITDYYEDLSRSSRRIKYPLSSPAPKGTNKERHQDIACLMIFGHFKSHFERLPSSSVCRDHSCRTEKRHEPKEAEKTGKIVPASEDPPCQCLCLWVHLTRTRPNYSAYFNSQTRRAASKSFWARTKLTRCCAAGCSFSS